MNVNKDNYNVTFSFENVTFLGIVGDYYFILGRLSKNQKKCIIKVKKPIYNKAFKAWANEIQDYCERWGHLCGVDFTESTGVIEVTEGWLWSERTKNQIPCKVVHISDIYTECEHG